MQRDDWIILLLGLPDQDGTIPPVDQVRVMKCLFVAGERIKQLQHSDDYYEFRPYHYGPFTAVVYSDADTLEGEGFLDKIKVGRYDGYVATQAGVERAAILAERHPEAADYLRQVRSWANGISFTMLLKAIYKEWPQYRANSVFFG